MGETRSKEIAAIRRAASTLGGVGIILLALVALAASDSAVADADTVVDESPKPDPNEMLFAMARELKQDAVAPASEETKTVAQALALEAVGEVDENHQLITKKHNRGAAKHMKVVSAKDVIHTPAWLKAGKAQHKKKKKMSDGIPTVARVLRDAQQTSKEAQEPLSVERKAEIAAKRAEDEAKVSQVSAAAKATAKVIAAAKAAAHSAIRGRIKAPRHAPKPGVKPLHRRGEWLKDMKPKAAAEVRGVTKEVLAAANIAASAERHAAQVLRRASHSVLGGPVVYSTAAAKERDMQNLMDDTQLANSQAKESDEEDDLVRAQIAQTRQEIRLEEARGGVPKHNEDVDTEEEFLEVYAAPAKKVAKKAAKQAPKKAAKKAAKKVAKNGAKKKLGKSAKLSKQLKAAKKAKAKTKFRALKAKIAANAAIKRVHVHKSKIHTHVTRTHADFLKAQVQQAQETLRHAHVSKKTGKLPDDKGVANFIKNAASVLKKPWKKKPHNPKDSKKGPSMPKIDFDKIGIHEADLEVARQQQKIENDAARAGAKAGMALARKQMAKNPIQVKHAIEAKLKRFKTPHAAAFNSHRMAQRAADEAKDAASNVLSSAAANTKQALEKQEKQEEAATMKPFNRHDIIKKARSAKIVRAVTPLASRTADAVAHELVREDAKNQAARLGTEIGLHHKAPTAKKAKKAKKAEKAKKAKKTKKNVTAKKVDARTAAVRKALRIAMHARKRALALHKAVRAQKKSSALKEALRAEKTAPAHSRYKPRPPKNALANGYAVHKSKPTAVHTQPKAVHHAVHVVTHSKHPAKKLGLESIGMRVQQAIAAAAAKENKHSNVQNPVPKPVKAHKQHKKLKPQPTQMTEKPVHTVTPVQHSKVEQKVRKPTVQESSKDAAVKAFLEGISD